MDGVLFGVLAAGVQEYLRGVGKGAEPDRGPEPPEVHRLVAAWRALLRMHELGGDGKCVRCGHARRWLVGPRPAGCGSSSRRFLAEWLPIRRRPAEFCTVWQVAVGYFIRRLPGSVP